MRGARRRERPGEGTDCSLYPRGEEGGKEEENKFELHYGNNKQALKMYMYMYMMYKVVYVYTHTHVCVC